MAGTSGTGSATAKKANAKAEGDGKKNPRKSSAAQSELGKKAGEKSWPERGRVHTSTCRRVDLPPCRPAAVSTSRPPGNGRGR